MSVLLKPHYKDITLSIFIIMLVGMLPGVSYAATYYMPDNFANLQAAFAGMHGGDTLIIRDGTYTGASNILDSNHMPPTGSSAAYTTFKAEHDGSVVFDGQNSINMFSVVGGSQNKYWRFEGIIWCRNYGTNVEAYQCNYLKFFRCGAYDAGAGNNVNWNMNRCSYILIENCYAWGTGRSKFAAYRANHVIFRTCVARMDSVDTVGTNPTYTYGMYSVDYGLVQNCIAIDSDQTSYYNTHGGDYSGSFATPSTDQNSTNVTYQSCVVLNSHVGGIGSSANQTYKSFGTTWNNCVIWDASRPDASSINYWRGVNDVINHCTFGLASNTYYGFNSYCDTSNNTTFYNNIICNYVGGTGGFYAVENEDYGCYYNNTNTYAFGTTKGSHTRTATNPIWNSTTNPSGSLKYITRIEQGSSLSRCGSDGGDIGANLKNIMGVSGTLWGESGYNSDSGVSMWPFPNEALIKTKMAAYYKGGVSGARGFCAGTSRDGNTQTLTKYIWEYLGNTIPADIYGGGSTTDTAPARPTGVTVIVK